MDMKSEYEEIYYNPIMMTDAYNLSHFFLKENVDKEISLLFNRNRSMILNGFSQAVHSIVDEPITEQMVIEAENHATNMGMPFPRQMWHDVIDQFDGYLPLKIEALPDGTYVPKNTPFAKITNTIKGFGEICTWHEPVYMQTSFDSGCATRAFDIRRYLEQNKLPLNRIHSFGLRGHNSWENAVKAGKAWRLFLNGTDDFHTQDLTDGKGQSIPATAHKTIQQFDNELDAYYHSIDQTKAHGFNIVALVIDTYDPLRFIKYYSKIIAQYGRDKGVHVVFRPDSGLVKDQAFALYTIMHSFDLLKDTSCIIGESITLDRIKEYDTYFKKMGCDLKWFNYGMGSGFYKDIDRDYLGFAMKTSYSNGSDRMKFSADKFKESMPGDVRLFNVSGDIWATYHYFTKNIYETIYELDGESRLYTWKDIKKRAKQYIKKDNLQLECKIGGDVSLTKNSLRKKYITDIKLDY